MLKILILLTLIASCISNNPDKDVQQPEKDESPTDENGIIAQKPVNPTLPVQDTQTPRSKRPPTLKPPPFTPRPSTPDGIGIIGSGLDDIGTDGVIPSDGIIRGAVSTRHRIKFFDAPVQTAQITPQIIEFDGGQLPLTLRFRSASSRINIQQIHSADESGGEERTKSEDKPYLIFHESNRPVIQEVREIITPYRRVVQQIQPVQEEIHTYVARGKDRQITDFVGTDGEGRADGRGDRTIGGTVVRKVDARADGRGDGTIGGTVGKVDGRAEGKINGRVGGRDDGKVDGRVVGGVDGRGEDGSMIDGNSGGITGTKSDFHTRNSGIGIAVDSGSGIERVAGTGVNIGSGHRTVSGKTGTKSVINKRSRGTGIAVDSNRRYDFNRRVGATHGTETLNIRLSHDSDVLSTGESKRRIEFDNQFNNHRHVGLKTPFGEDLLLLLDAEQLIAMQYY